MPEISPRVAGGSTRGNAAGSSRGIAAAQSSRGTKKGAKNVPQQRVAESDEEMSNHEDDDHEEPSSPILRADEAKNQKGKKGKKGNAKRTFNGTRAPPKRERMPVHKRLNIFFPVGRIGRYLRKGHFSRRVGSGAPVFLAAVLDYMVGELVEVACDAAKAHGRATVKPRHIQLGIRDDVEFMHLLGKVTISQGGGNPRIDPFLTKKLVQKKKVKPIDEEDRDDEDEEMEEPKKGKATTVKQSGSHGGDESGDEETDEEYESEGEEQEEQEDENGDDENGDESQEYGED